MIEYSYSLFDLKDVTTTATRGKDRWSVRLKHKPSGISINRSGNGQYEHQINERREAMEELKNQVDTYYKEQYDNANK